MNRTNSKTNIEMNKTVSVGLGGRNFIFDEDAYTTLNLRLGAYEASLSENARDVLEEVEMRIADLLKEKMAGHEFVSRALVEQVSMQMGLPEYNAAGECNCNADKGCARSDSRHPLHKFFRDTDDRKIGGVCSGIAAYGDIDVVIVRIIALVLLLCGTAGFWIYLIICIVAPSAYTAVEKCQLRGLPCTADNIRRFRDTSR